jgi:hypothetical protein
MERVMNNLLNSIKTRFFNADLASDSCELKNLKSENAAARVLTPEGASGTVFRFS